MTKRERRRQTIRQVLLVRQILGPGHSLAEVMRVIQQGSQPVAGERLPSPRAR